MNATLAVQSGAWHRRLLDMMTTAAVALDTDGRIVVANPALCELLDWTQDELVGRDWFETAIAPEAREAIREVHARIIRGEIEATRLYDNEVRDRGGKPRLVAWRNEVMTDEQGAIIGTLSIGAQLGDEGVRVRSLRQAVRRMDDLRYALDQAAIVARTDRAGKIHYVNDRFCEISGYSRDELIGQDHRIINSGHHPRSFMRDLLRTIGRGDVWRGEICNRAKDGRLYWVDSTLVPLRGEDGTVSEYVAVRTDVTDRKRAERTLREKEALTRLGEMASVVAHEVRNPLAGIGGALQIILRRMEETAPERAVVGDILERIRTLNETLEDLLAFARPKRARLVTLEVTAFLRSTVDRIRDDPRTHGVNFEIEDSDLLCMADPGMLNGVMLNLLLNAAQATGAKGTVRIEIRSGGGYCQLRVVDDGPGIPVEIRDRIFEPFFTTRARGTGLGLPTVKRWVEAQGGDLAYECPTTGGTVMVVRLALPSL